MIHYLAIRLPDDAPMVCFHLATWIDQPSSTMAQGASFDYPLPLLADENEDGITSGSPAAVRHLLREVMPFLGWDNIDDYPEVENMLNLNLQAGLHHALNCSCGRTTYVPLFSRDQVRAGILAPAGSAVPGHEHPCCPGCGAGIDDPVSHDCDHPQGCGHYRALHN